MDGGSQRLVTQREAILRVASALSSGARLDILEACRGRFLSITELSRQLGMPQSTVTNHVQALEEAELVVVKSEAGRRGRQKLCTAAQEALCFAFPGAGAPDGNRVEVDMPVGLFTRVHVTPPCGLASPARQIGERDFPGAFLLPERVGAGIVWFAGGWVEYLFPRNFPADAVIAEVEISFEACSEAVGYDHDWPSDISVWLNDVKLATWTCPSDYGRPRGILNPQWWQADQTQYGELKVLSVRAEGTFLDGARASDVTPGSLNLGAGPTLRLRIGVEKGAPNQGGVNLLGCTFGNFEQDIKLVVSLANDLP